MDFDLLFPPICFATTSPLLLLSWGYITLPIILGVGLLPFKYFHSLGSKNFAFTIANWWIQTFDFTLLFHLYYTPISLFDVLTTLYQLSVTTFRMLPASALRKFRFYDSKLVDSNLWYLLFISFLFHIYFIFQCCNLHWPSPINFQGYYISNILRV